MSQGVVEIAWMANPMRGDRFEELWRPAAEAVLRYGAKAYLFMRSRDDQAKFMQFALFDEKLDFDRYWYSEEIAEARALASGLFQVPVLPEWHGLVSAGSLEGQPIEA